MELIRGLHNLRARHRGCVVTIGTYDGIHRGHRHVVSHLIGHARSHGLPAVAMLFEPQPREYFMGAQAPARLSLLREKIDQLAALGVDRVLCVRFDARFLGLSADEFVVDLMVGKLGAKVMVVGDDFRFARNRTATVADLQRFGERYGFEVDHAEVLLLEGERVSSTRVRNALAAGDFDLAARLLGRPYSLSGRVIHGQRRGRTIGFPTANLALHRRTTPIAGIFAVTVEGLERPGMPAVAYVGTRPIVAGVETLLEVHLFDYEGEIYGRRIHVDFHARIRGDMQFSDFAGLQAQIARDSQQARRILDARVGCA
ncbi:MAG: bifunctional riboflavin kinase/FAD synthetase [Gammaproteobacteria bacterium]